jgi:hypothetical protein
VPSRGYGESLSLTWLNPCNAADIKHLRQPGPIHSLSDVKKEGSSKYAADRLKYLTSNILFVAVMCVYNLFGLIYSVAYVALKQVH